MSVEYGGLSMAELAETYHLSQERIRELFMRDSEIRIGGESYCCYDAPA